MRRRNHPLSWDRRRLIRCDSVYHTPADPCLPDCSIFLHTYLNYWNCGITIFHWFIDASPRLSRSPLLPRLCLLSRFRFLCIPLAPSPSRWLLGSFIFTIQGIVKKKKEKSLGIHPRLASTTLHRCLYIEHVLHGCPTHVAGYSDGHNIFNIYINFLLVSSNKMKKIQSNK